MKKVVLIMMSVMATFTSVIVPMSCTFELQSNRKRVKRVLPITKERVEFQCVIEQTISDVLNNKFSCHISCGGVKKRARVASASATMAGAVGNFLLKSLLLDCPIKCFGVLEVYEGGVHVVLIAQQGDWTIVDEVSQFVPWGRTLHVSLGDTLSLELSPEVAAATQEAAPVKAVSVESDNAAVKEVCCHEAFENGAPSMQEEVSSTQIKRSAISIATDEDLNMPEDNDFDTADALHEAEAFLAQPAGNMVHKVVCSDELEQAIVCPKCQKNVPATKGVTLHIIS